MVPPRHASTDLPSAGSTQLSADAAVSTASDAAADEYAVFVADREGTITGTNQAFSAMFCDEEPAPDGDEESAPASLRTWLADDAVAADVVASLRDGEAVGRDLTLSTAAGDARTVRLEAMPIDADGVGFVVGVCTDITARKRTERTRRLYAEVCGTIGAAATYRDGLEHTLDAICTYTEWAYGEVWTPDHEAGELTYTLGHTDDPELEAFHAASESVTFEFGVGLPGRVYESQSPEWIPDVSAEPAAVFHRTDLASEVGVRAALGVPVVADETVVAVLAFFLRERRAIDGALAADVSHVAASLGGLVARRQTEGLLHEHNERLEEFASVVSHDLRNPLNVASGTLDLVRKEADSDRLATVAAAHDRMEELIEDLLLLARQNKPVDSTESVALAEVVTDCWRTVDTAEATLAVAVDRVIEADRSRLRQLIENLFRNAVAHGGSDVTVTVGDLPTGFYIEDDGSGIDADAREQVFDHGHSTTTEGNGLGLAIVREIAQAHGWSISVTDGAAGGARFEITGVEWTD